MKQVLNLGALGKQHSDHQMSKEEKLEWCVERITWLANQVMGARDEKGTLYKEDYKDKDGNVINSVYQVGLLQKFEGVWDFNEQTKLPELKQPGMEQLWQQLKNMVDALVFEKQIQQAILGVMLKIDPDDMADFFDKHEVEVNRWALNYKNRMQQNLAKMEKDEKQKAEELKAAGVMPAENNDQN